MLNRPKKQNISIQQVLTALLDDKNFFPPAYLHQFSDLEGVDLAALRSVWPQASGNRRFTLLEDLEELAEEDTLVSFDNVAKMALEDEDPRVRTIAVRLLWESEDTKLADEFGRMLLKDPDFNVRAAAATALGLFVYLGELEEITEEIHHSTEDLLIDTVNGTDEILVRRRALEALGFSGREEVPTLIRKGYEDGSHVWLESALFAMGRSADETWAPEVLRMLGHSQTTVQIEAVRAAGELALEAARRPMLLLLDDELIDTELRTAVYWSLSKIGGDDVRETLEERLEETEDDEEAEIIEDALENLDFTEEMNLFDMLDLDDLPADDESAEEYLSRHNSRVIDADALDALPGDDEKTSPAAESADADNESEDESDASPAPKSSSGNKRHRHRRSG
jgi:HEAT repeat protein